jgi:putative aldouronate transport system substrate-binding protein
MKKTVLLLAALSLAMVVVLGGCRKQAATQDTGSSFTLLIDADRAPAPGWYGIYDVIEKETGVKVDFLIYPYQAAVEQKNILLSTGNYPDAIGGWLVGANDVLTLSAEKVIIPLENLIMNNTKNVREALEVPGIRASMTLPDGHIYSPPYLVEEPLVSFNPWINKNWLDQLGLQVPTTTDELKQVLIAFRDRIPNVAGQRIIPFSGDPVNKSLGTMAGWWGVNASNGGVNAGYFAVINGRIESTAIREEYKAAIKFFADLYKERLLDPELFTQDKATWEAKGKRGLYGAVMGYGPGDFVPDIDPRDRERDPSRNWTGWVPLPVLKAPGVANPVFRNNNNGNSLFRTQFVITDKAQGARAETIMKWLDACYEPTHSFEFNAGPKDKTWKVLSQSASQTIYQFVDTSTWTEDERQMNGWGGYSVPSQPRFQRPKAVWTEQPRPGWENEYKDLDIRDALYKPFLEKVTMPALWFNTDDGRRVADLQTAIVSYIEQKEAEWVSGQANIDAEWDAYVAQLNRLGLQELLTLKRNAANL